MHEASHKKMRDNARPNYGNLILKLCLVFFFVCLLLQSKLEVKNGLCIYGRYCPEEEMNSRVSRHLKCKGVLS